MPVKPTFLESLHHVSAPEWVRTAYGIVRAGKVSARPDYSIVRDVHIGQDILYCLSGSGVVESLGQKHDIRPLQLVWIANEQPHAHRADPDDPWTLLWFRLVGPNPIALRQKLFGNGAPLVTIAETAALQAWFERLFAAMRGGGTGLDFRLNHLVGEFLASMDIAVRGDRYGELPEPLEAALSAMRADLRRAWSGEDLSQSMRLSASQVRRMFSRHLQTSPHQWLLRERLTHAQGLIADSAASLAEIAERCGFCDVYHFSREFKRSIGSPPAAWRRNELGNGKAVSHARSTQRRIG